MTHEVSTLFGLELRALFAWHDGAKHQLTALFGGVCVNWLTHRIVFRRKSTLLALV
jgi:hypothetical protein